MLDVQDCDAAVSAAILLTVHNQNARATKGAAPDAL
jgi:hypothetical protein